MQCTSKTFWSISPKSHPWGKGSSAQAQSDILLEASQPAAIGKPTNCLTQNPKSDPQGSVRLTFFEMVSQPAAIGQPPSHLKSCQPDPKWDLVGCLSFTSIHRWHFVQYPAIQLQLASQPAIWSNVNLTLSLIWQNVNLTWPKFSSHRLHLTKCQPDSRSHPWRYIWPHVNLNLHLIWPNVNLTWPIVSSLGVPSDQMSIWHYISSDKMSTWPDPKSHLTGSPPDQM